jgi:hypothetical protein
MNFPLIKITHLGPSGRAWLIIDGGSAPYPLGEASRRIEIGQYVLIHRALDHPNTGKTTLYMHRLEWLVRHEHEIEDLIAEAMAKVTSV